MAGEGAGEAEVRLHHPTPGPRETKPQWPTAVTAPLLAPASPLPAPLCPTGPLSPISGPSPFCRSRAKTASVRLEVDRNHPVLLLLYL